MTDDVKGAKRKAPSSPGTNEAPDNTRRKFTCTNRRVTRAHPEPVSEPVSAKPFRLLDLPGELRNKIYEQVLTKRGDLNLRELFWKSTPSDIVAKPHRIGMKHPLLMSCKLVRSECTGILVKKNYFSISDFYGSPWFVRPSASAVRSSITRLRIQEYGARSNRQVEQEFLESCTNLKELKLELHAFHFSNFVGFCWRLPTLHQLIERLKMEKVCQIPRLRSLVLYFADAGYQTYIYQKLDGVLMSLKQWIEARLLDRRAQVQFVYNQSNIVPG